MQIVIEIPEIIYDTIQSDEMISREQLAILQMRIMNVTLLPKGHGRLIDADAYREALKLAIEDTDKIANHLTTLYPYLYISSDGDNFGDKSEIKEDIKELKYLSYMLSRELLKIIDNEKEV